MSARASVFVSYSHKDRDLLSSLVAQLKSLEQAGLLDVWVDTRIDAGEKWYPEIEAAMKRAAVAVCLISEHFLASDFCTKEEVPFLLKRAEQDGLLLIPVLLSDCPWYAHRWVEERQMLPGEGQSVRTHFPSNPAAAFSKVAKRIYDKLKDPKYQPPKPRVEWPELPDSAVDLTRLPETGAALFGRDDELKLLDTAWTSAEKPGKDHTRVLAFVAYGGVGKSTLVNHWLHEMERDSFRGAMRVFGWSFYSQGAREEGMASADTFIAAALEFFGDKEMAHSAASPWDKGERLARLAGAERALLVLDGMEPLQSGHAFDRGKLRDPALESLLRGLARRSDGLCLITTREPLPDLAGLAGVTARDLEQITPEAGRALLRTARVVGTDAELEALAKRFGPHALAVSLLGVYLHEKDPGHGAGPARALEQLSGKEPIDQVLGGFELLLADSAELEVLRLLGLFDRPSDAGCLGALRAKPSIPSLTDRMVKLSDADWDRALARLEKLRLIHVLHKTTAKPAIDAHPLVREHFANQLRGQQPDAWRSAHRRLYEHLKESTEQFPTTLEGLQPLYQAMAHGCNAGMQQEACDEIYRDRILRGVDSRGFYSTKQLGAFGADIGAVACFFKQPWNRISPALIEPAQAWLLNQAAFYLRALGRLTEALEPIRAGLEMNVKQETWKNAAISASNLSELQLTLGVVAGAVDDAEQSVTYADRTGDANQRLKSRGTLADALFHAGRLADALGLWQGAEAVQAKCQPDYPLLYSTGGFRYCDLLLAEAERAAWKLQLNPKLEVRNSKFVETCREVEQRAAQTLKWAEQGNLSLLTIALDHLTLGRAALYRAQIGEAGAPATPKLPSDGGPATPKSRPRDEGGHGHVDAGALATARTHLDQAVAGLRRSGNQDKIPHGLLTRAWCSFAQTTAHKLRNEHTEAAECEARARADLGAAWEIAERGPMKLFLADIYLHRARLFRDKEELKKARALIEQCGYWRRKEELEDAEAAAKGW